MNRPIAIVLGGTLPHKDLIIKLKNRGFKTVLIDYYENPIAKECTDIHLQESTLDKEKVLKIAREYNARLVISIYIDQANVTACYVSEKLGLPHPYSYETALLITNKQLMKQRMLEYGIPTSRFYKINSVSDISDMTLTYPVIVKPSDNNSSKGIHKVTRKADLPRFCEIALQLSRCNEAIVEEFIEGQEVGVDCFIKDKSPTILITKERRKIKSIENDVQQIFGCFWPASLSSNIENKFVEIARKIAYSFNLNNTPLMIQAIVHEDEINVIEFAGRYGGGESFRIIKLSTEFDTTQSAIDSFLGNDVELNNVPPKYIYAENFIYCKPGIFQEIVGYEKLIEDRTIEFIDAFKTKGMEIESKLTSNNRVGVLGIKADNKNTLVQKIEKALKEIDVLDINDKSIMREDIYEIT